MVAIKLIVLSLACICVNAVPRTPPVTRNTIFADERLEGQIFEDVDAFDNIELSPRNGSISPYRLPTTTVPTHYNVLWAIDISRLSYSGTVDIQLHATQANVREIVIHCDHLELSSVVLRLGTATVATTYRNETAYHFLRIALTNGVLQYNANSPVIYTLSIAFAAPMRTDMYGIYSSWFRNNPTDTAVSWMASTQFQATAGRYAFPCYDEPKFKATFDVVIRRPTNYKSWFCTRLNQTRASTFQGYQEDVYYRTPLMSTYLLALIVAQYDSLTSFNTNGLLMHEVIARPGAISAGQGTYAMATGQALLAEMNDHTAYNFYDQNPNLKMTQASIPDFGAGAMENWGLLTYREAYLMYDPAHTNSNFQQIIAYILSHEIAHMWFGNLVTNDWWDVLWLNEGFARYYQYFLTYWVEDMGFATRFITEQVHTALLADSSNNPHPLTNPGVGSPASVSAMFSTISYNKGAAVIRMTEHLLGFEVHRQGLRNYLRLKNFQTATPLDLFTALQSAGNQAGALNYGSNFNFIDYYRSWTEQAGHPVLNVEVNHRTGNMTIYQRRFNINTGYGSANTNYIIPITFATAANPNFSNTKPSHILTEAVTVINRNSVGDQWVIFNNQQTGYYRVNYDDYTWDLIVIALRGPQRTLIHEYNRAQIVNDVFQFARSGLMSYNRAFNILSFLENETEYAPWVAAMTGFSWLRNRLAGTNQLNTLNEMIARWGTTVMNQLTYYPIPNENFMRSYLRFQLAPVMCAIGVPACLTAATEQFNNLRGSNQTEVPVDSRPWVYCSALRRGTQDDFNFLWNRFQRHNVYTEKIMLLQNLGCTPHAASLNTFMTAIVQDNYIIRPQDYTSAFNSAVSGNEGNTQIAFTFIRNNLQAVINAFGSAATPLSYVSARLRTEAEVNEFQQWATANQATLSTSYNSIYNGAESARQSIRWAASVSGDINSYFVNGDQTITSTTSTTPVPPIQTTSAQPPLAEPVTPDLQLPSSAATSFASVFLMAIVAIVNFTL